MIDSSQSDAEGDRKKRCPALKYFFDVCEMESLVLSVQLLREIWIKYLHLCHFQVMEVLFVL